MVEEAQDSREMGRYRRRGGMHHRFPGLCAIAGAVGPGIAVWEGMAVVDDVLLVLALLAGAAAAVLLRTAYVVTKDPATRRMLARWGWPLAALAIVLGIVLLAVEHV